ncbi:farnesyl-diphosphate farnesyltransferase [Aureococcus anophagefferens]|nr:farnesyl-diphosphate farnesyltransferase [Aureococcus anophagefferens]
MDGDEERKEEGEVWSPEGKSQDDFMLKDECIVLDYGDNVIGHDNKYNCHKFTVGMPKGILHRAFSVMLFDVDGKLLLQQRSGVKITFADVWTNTCCSHPLHGMSPKEVDDPGATLGGDPAGVKVAAVRKLDHELGIAPGVLDPKKFTFTTRVHYFAADLKTHGPDAPWGEHEIDYLLIYKLDYPGSELQLAPHPHEVSATKWVTQEELFREMEAKDSMPLWSPWFEIIAKKFLKTWWEDLTASSRASGARTTGKCEPFLDELQRRVAASTPEAVEGVLADAFREQMLKDVASTTAVFGASGAEMKQGAYGKVPTHKTSKLKQLLRPFEFCNDMLCKVSRSFAAVIQQLPAGCCIDICVFYLVLRAGHRRGDMTYYKGRLDVKQAELRSFHEARLMNPDAPPIMGCGEGDERVLLEQFGAVARVFATLPKESRDVIKDITDKMGGGMADYVTADLVQGTKDEDAYNLYCHNVAGLVGEGLTGIFAGALRVRELAEGGLLKWPFCGEDNKLGLANSMGLFLQKTNIIRDYLEDYATTRVLAKTVWSKHATTGDLGDFTRPCARLGVDKACLSGYAAEVAKKGASDRALACLDELIADALELVPDALKYLEKIKTPEVYRFCAIPQVMAIATLVECFDNPKLFTGVVKIRKGMAARLIVDTQKGHGAVLKWFRHFGEHILDRVDDCHATSSDKWRLIAAATRVVASTPEPPPYKKKAAFLVTVGYLGYKMSKFAINWIWWPLLIRPFLLPAYLKFLHPTLNATLIPAITENVVPVLRQAPVVGGYF